MTGVKLNSKWKQWQLNRSKACGLGRSQGRKARPMKAIKALDDATLPGAWKRWRAHRKCEYLKGGMIPQSAARFADLEALARARLAKKVGFKAAKSARLFFNDDEDGNPVWYLEIHKEDVPEKFYKSAQAEFLIV